MGMTDKQFDAYNRLLMKRIKHVMKLLEESDSTDAKKELADILDDLQKSLED